MSYKKPPQEPIAIVGSGCRLAGGVDRPSKLWELLSNPLDLSKQVPTDRFSAKGFYHPDGEYHGTTNSIKAYWLEQDFRVFDATFFKIAPKEAEAMDPQQRMTLEVVYEAMESAGYTLQQLAGEQVSVFAGLMTADYDSLSQRDELTASQYYATGNARSILSNRISYFFNWHGPSMTIDTACSSSLVALHQAVLSLRAGESTMACVAGANLMLTPEQFIVESNLHMLSPTGHSRMWDAAADGYARGEGVAAVFLKPLSQALKDGDVIQAVIRETGVNSDGRTQGITMPNPEAQTALIRETYRRAGLDSRDPNDRCQYFEAHGTGTQAGDPREAAAIEDAFFGKADQVNGYNDIFHSQETEQRKLLVGSIKTVVGHVEGAAGLAGVLKVVQCMQNGLVPPNLHLKKLNPSVEPFCSNLEVPTTLVPWPSAPSGQPLRASVNSFGFGGTNSHAVIEHYSPEIHDEVAKSFADGVVVPPKLAHATASHSEGMVIPIFLSANSQKSLHGLAEDYLEYVEEHEGIDIGRLGLDTFSRRTALPYRVAVSGASRPDMIKGLKSLCNKSQKAAVDIGYRARQLVEKPRILGVFTGQGAQWATMSRELFRTNRVYRETIRDLDDILRQLPDHGNWTLEEQILADEVVSNVNMAAISQPLCTALQIALVEVLLSLGVELDCVVGHSSGEIAAAYAAGRLTDRDAILIAFYRGLDAHLSRGEQGQHGGMMAVGISKAEAEELCARPSYSGKLCVAASNSPSLVTVSGDVDALDELQEELTKEKKFFRRLAVTNAYHSHHMKKPAAQYLKHLGTRDISLQPGNETTWVSTVYPDVSIKDMKGLDAAYWAENMVNPVLFNEGVDKALKTCGPFDCVIEIGPHPALRSPVLQIVKALDGGSIPYIGLLARRQDDRVTMADFIGFLWTRFGLSWLDLDRFIETSGNPELLVQPPLRDLPVYPWDHSQIHHRESRVSRQYQARHDPPHELLGVRTRDDTDQEKRWRNVLKLDKLLWMEGHQFQGQVLLPAAAYCIMAIDAAKTLIGDREASLIELEDLQFLSGITVEPESEGVEILLSLLVEPLTKADAITASFTLSHAPVGGTSQMKLSFTGKCTVFLGSEDVLPGRKMVQPETLAVTTDGFYQTMAGIGLDYSGPFKSMLSLERRFGFATSQLQRFHKDDTTKLTTSPATLDSCLQACFATFSSPGDNALWTSFLPKSMGRVQFNVAASKAASQSERLVVEAQQTKFTPITRAAPTSITGDVLVYNSRGALEIRVEDLTVGSFVSTKPEDDYELYLHTVMKADPEEKIDSNVYLYSDSQATLFKEQCSRVCRFYLYPNFPGSGFDAHDLDLQQDTSPREDEVTIQELVLTSPFFSALESVRKLAWQAPVELSSRMPVISTAAAELFAYQQHLMTAVSQIAHKYPRMNVFSLTDPELGLNVSALEGLQTSFTSYTFGAAPEKNIWHRLSKTDALDQKVKYVDVDLTKPLAQQLGSTKFDMVLFSAKFLHGHDARHIFKELKNIMRPGGFLFLAHVEGLPIKTRLKDSDDDSEPIMDLPTPPNWPDLLDVCGFDHKINDGDMSLPLGCNLIVRQSSSQLKNMMRKPLENLKPTQQTKDVLIVGGASDRTRGLAAGLQKILRPSCGNLDSVPSFSATESLGSYTSVIILAELDAPFLTCMTAEKLEALKAILKPNMVILWVTQGAINKNPDCAASFGFARTLLAETPGLTLQMLDFNILDDATRIIAETFARLMRDPRLGGEEADEDALWTYEPEIHIKKGIRIVPRVMPYQPANDRVNAPRRIVEKTLNTLRSRTRILPQTGADGFTGYRSVILDHGIPSHNVQMNVEYSSARGFRAGRDDVCYVCLGKNNYTGETLIAMSLYNESRLYLPNWHTVDISRAQVDHLKFMSILLRIMNLATIDIKLPTNRVIILLDDETLRACIPGCFKPEGANVGSLLVSADHPHALHRGFVHPLVSARELLPIFDQRNTIILDFCEDTKIKNLAAVLELCRFCEYHRPADPAVRQRAALPRHDIAPGQYQKGRFNDIVEFALSQAQNEKISAPVSIVSVPKLLEATHPAASYTLIDWRAERFVKSQVDYQVRLEDPLSADRTYVLVGITKDLGQSLCTLLVEHGAKNLVLASRSPNLNPRWARELRHKGVNVRIEAVDVTDIFSVQRFADTIEATMPRVAGLVNGAMVLDDRVFSQMTLETWNRVMLPKTLGSKNLNLVFGDYCVDFFIMTSSFAAIGGHAGQSNYAAANMYMNGLAANRRRCNLPGSVLNIGVIYGLGFLHREKDNLYDGLEREGYPPISERDLHHMFMEAIVAGKPYYHDNPDDLTTGLRRFRPDDPNPLHWHRDPRFSHFTVQGGASSSGGTAGQENGKSISEQVKDATTLSEVVDVLLPALTKRLETLLRLPAGTVTGESSFAEIGVDSLVAVEIRSWIWKTLGKDVPVMKILGCPSILSLCSDLAGQLMSSPDKGTVDGDST